MVVSIPSNPCFMTILSRKGEGCPLASSGQEAHSAALRQHHEDDLEFFKMTSMPNTPIRPKDRFLVFGAPAIEDAEIQEVVATMKSGWLGTGPKVSEFEKTIRCL